VVVVVVVVVVVDDPPLRANSRILSATSAVRGRDQKLKNVMLGYQKLDVYQCAVRLLALCARLSTEVPKPRATSFDGAAVSTPLNIAEGSGRPAAGDATRFIPMKVPPLRTNSRVPGPGARTQSRCPRVCPTQSSEDVGLAEEAAR
jgi:hypothetical protein